MKPQIVQPNPCGEPFEPIRHPNAARSDRMSQWSTERNERTAGWSFARVALGLVLTLTSLRTLAADDNRVTGERQPVSPVGRDVIFLHDDRPIFLRFHIEVDRTNFDVRWRDSIAATFRAIDANDDGRLTRHETDHKADSTDSSDDQGAATVLRLADLWAADNDPFDHAITVEEFTRFLIARQRGPFQPPENGSSGIADVRPNSGNRAGQILLDLIDQNDDRKLTGEELARATTSLARRDLDDDGTFSVSELTAGGTAYNVAQPAGAPPGGQSRFAALTPGHCPPDVLRELVRRYGQQPRSGAASGGMPLSRDLDASDLGLDDQTFAAFDADANGKLDFDELRRLLRSPPTTIELIVRLGQRSDSTPQVDLIGSPKSAAVSIRRSADGLMSVVVDGIQVEIGQISSHGPTVKQILLEQFQRFDRDNNNYLDATEAERVPVFNATFDEFDSDGNGKVVEEEVVALIDAKTAVARIRTRMEIRNRGRDLFEILDVDRNGQLGARELTQAATRIELWDNDADNAIAEVEVPQLYQLSFGPGQPVLAGLNPERQARQGSGPNGSRSLVGPLWFRKMDRNQDGEIAWREFLGSRAEFRKVDLNDDGAIDSSEADRVK